MVLGSANTSTSLVEHHKYKSGSAVAKTTKTTDLYQATDMTVGSQLSGETVSVMGTTHHFFLIVRGTTAQYIRHLSEVAFGITLRSYVYG